MEARAWWPLMRNIISHLREKYWHEARVLGLLPKPDPVKAQ